MKKNRMNKKQAEKLLATVVMGMNLVNTAAPLAALATAEQKLGAAAQPVRSEAEPLDYAVLPQLADAVERVIFARAEAADYDGNASVASMGSGDTQTITAGQSGTVSTMTNGNQTISGGGSGTVSTMHGGIQDIQEDGTGTISTMEYGGWQYVSAGGTGIVNTMSVGGWQYVSSGGTGTVSTMNDGNQNISSGGTGTVSTMSGGFQNISSGGVGTVSNMNSGHQYISSGGTGSVGVINNDGEQTIYSGGTGTVSAIVGLGGTQTISAGGVGIVSTMDTYSGIQYIESGGVGIISTMSAYEGHQNIASGGTGTVINMNNSTGDNYQTINSGGVGTVSAMNGSYCYQNISSGGVGTISSLLGGSQNVSSGGTALDTVIAGGTQLVSVGAVVSGATLSAGIQQVYDGNNLNNITFAGGTQAVMSGAAVSGMQVANGVQSIASGGSAADTVVSAGGSLQLNSGGIVSSLTLTSGSLDLENIDGGSFTVSGTLTANDAVINMTDSSVNRGIHAPAYETLTIDKLSGSGTTFVMDTDLAGETNSDKIIITDADTNATHYVQIKDLSKLNGSEVTGAHQQLLITDVSVKLTFEGKEFNAGGLWDVDPTLAQGDSLGLSANDWYLTKLEKTANNDTQVLLDAADNSYALWRNTNDSLRSRLGALASGSEQSDGIWARTQAGRFSGDNYEGRYNLYQLGFDQAANAKSVYGAAVDYGDGNGSYDNGSGKDKLKSFSLYGVWTGDNGAYTNVTARYGMVSTDLESYGDYPDKAEYKQHAYSVSVEYGKRFDMERGFFVEPQAQFTLGRLGSIDYTTDRGANGYIEGMNSAIGRIGFVMGQKITGDSDIYLKADLLHEFAGERDLQLTSDAGGTNDMLTKHNDYGDTWFELGLGANIKVSKTASVYGEIERGFGGDINKKWSVNGGVRFTF